MRFIFGIVVALATVLPAPASAAPPEPSEISRFLVSQGFAVLKLSKLPTGHEVIDVVINGQAGTFVLDSGAGATVLRHDRLTKFGIVSGTDKQQGAGAGGSIAITRHPIGSIALDGQALPLRHVYSTNLDSVVGRLRAATGIEIDGVVGQDILSGFSAIINIGSSELYLKLPAG